MHMLWIWEDCRINITYFSSKRINWIMVYHGKYCITVYHKTGRSTTLTYLHILRLFGWETWSLALKQEHRLKLLKTRVLRIILGLVGWCNKGLEETAWCGVLGSVLSPNNIQVINKEGWVGLEGWHVWKGKVHIGYS